MKKIAIISDSHDNIPNINKALDFINQEKIDTILHCGDISSPDTLNKTIKIRFPGKLYFVCGNAGDPYLLKKMAEITPNFYFFDPVGKIKINDKKISFCHFPETARKLALDNKSDIIFHGDTHKPWEERVKKTKIINPGNLAGVFYKSTFAVYNTENNKLELKIVDNL